MNKRETGELLAMLAVIYPEGKFADVDKAVAVWHAVLEPFSFADIRQALMDYSRGDNRFMPKPGQLIALIANDAYDDLVPDVVWSEVMTEVRRHPYGVKKIAEQDDEGAWRSVENPGPQFSHPLIAETVRGIGWQTICQCEDVQEMQRTFFFALRAVKERAKTDMRLGHRPNGIDAAGASLAIEGGMRK